VDQVGALLGAEDQVGIAAPMRRFKALTGATRPDWILSQRV